MDRNTERILRKLPASVDDRIRQLPDSILDKFEEIRLKTFQDTLVIGDGREISLHDRRLMTPEILDETLNRLLDYSYYAYEDELSKGYITIEGGHRVGICGTVTLRDGNVHLIKDISSLNIRRSSEIAGCTGGESSYDLGSRTDILDGCPKAEGILMLIRSMSPDVIITDEIGRHEDVGAIEAALCAGVKTITTIHGSSFEDVENSAVGELIRRHVFETLIFLSAEPCTGTVKRIMKLSGVREAARGA